MSNQSQGDSFGSSSSEPKKPSQGRRGVHKPHHGRSPQSAASGKDDSTQKRIRNLQQKSHDKTTEYKLRPQTSRSEHTGKSAQRSSNTSGLTKSKGSSPHPKKGLAQESDSTETKSKKPSKIGENGLHSKFSTSKDIKRNERKDSGIGHSPPSLEPPNELESTDTSVVDLSSGGPANSEVEEQEKAVGTDEEGKSIKDETKTDIERFSYTRDELLALRNSPACLEKHPTLSDSTIDITFLKPPLLSKQSAESESEADVRRKHPTALSMIKEHDTKQLPKVSLSPQRKSFQSGCSWNDSKTQDTPPSSARDLSHQFDFESAAIHQPSTRINHTSSQQGPTPQPKHKVIAHIPLRDQEMGRGSKRNWREKNKEPEWAKEDRYQNTWEEEPEWMEFGPNDRFELIELKGLEEHEREREARLGREENQSKPQPGDVEDPLALEEEDKPKGVPSDKSDGEDETPGLPEKEREDTKESRKEEVMLKAAMEMDEFMLDGFDFSTGLSFFQGLDEDEEARSAQNPAKINSALLEVLKASAEEQPVPTVGTTKDKIDTSVSNRPVNALTLDEIHARENIQTTPAEPVPYKQIEDLGAFNKLVAGLQSSGALHKEASEAEQYQVKAKPTHHTSTPSTVSAIPMPITSISSTNVSVPIRPEIAQPPSSTFGNVLEKEMNFEEEVITGAHPHYQPPPQNLPQQYSNHGSSRVEHLERMLERLDHTHQNIIRDSRHKPLPPEGAPLHLPSGYPEQSMKKVMPTLGVRMSPGQIEGQRPYVVDREYVYPEGMGGEMRMDMLPPPNIGIRPQGGVNRSGANNWAVEMERRRLYELKQIERARMERMYSGSMHGGMQHKMPPSKPNISLLPTSVMRQMHNTKPNQSLSEVAKTKPVMAARLDQDPSNRTSMTHSPISFNEPEHPPPRLHPSHMYQMGGGQMRNVPPLRPVSDPAAAAMMYQRGYYNNNMPVMPHGGMQNPYMY